MKKIFSFNKFFIAFSIFFILVWTALQVVSHMRLTSMAKIDGNRILAWSWPDKNTRSTIAIYKTKILRKDHNDAIVKVLASQSIEPIVEQELNLATLESYNHNTPTKQMKADSKCAVTLTYYRTNNQWFLGRVDCE